MDFRLWDQVLERRGERKDSEWIKEYVNINWMNDINYELEYFGICVSSNEMMG